MHCFWIGTLLSYKVLQALTHMIPGHLVPHNGSPIDWSLWTNSPRPIWSPWTDGFQEFVPHGQMVPNQFGPPKQMVSRIFRLSRGIGCGDPNFWGPIVHEDQICCGPFVQGDQFYGDNLFRGTVKWVRDQMCRNRFTDQNRAGIRIL